MKICVKWYSFNNCKLLGNKKLHIWTKRWHFWSKKSNYKCKFQNWWWQ